jgi:L-glyceraldehyde 3-phosphate reductase
MPYRKCGRWGLKLPAITLGCWWNFGDDFDQDNARAMIHTAFDCGITHIDLANNYGPPYGTAEANVARIIRDDLPRDELVISTKAGYDMWPGPYGEWGSRKYMLASLDQSLRRMKLDYVDIYYSHRFDPDTPLEETMGALDSAVRQGKALYTGISSYSTEQTRKAVQVCKDNGYVTPIIHQPNYSMFNRWIEPKLLRACEALGMGIIAFCPLYQGVLTDKYLGGVPAGSRAATAGTLRGEEVADPVLDVVRQLHDHAQQRGQTLAQMALAWVLRDPRVTTALIGASRPEQITENVKAAGNTSFTGDELKKIDGILAQVKLPESLWAGEE